MKKIYNKYQEIVNYLIAGGLSSIVSLGTYLVFANTIFSEKSDLDIQFANVLSWIFAVIFAYIVNRIFVFKSTSKGKYLIKEAISFGSARIFTLIIDMILMFILYSIIHIDDTISKIIVQIVIVILNYILSKWIIFKKNK